MHTLQEGWNAHAYPDSSLTWMRFTVEHCILLLSENALKMLLALGQTMNQSGLIQASYEALSTLTGLSRTTVRHVIDELLKAGAIRIHRKAAGHDAAIYFVNPAIISKGRAVKTKTSLFQDGLSLESSDKYILNAVNSWPETISLKSKAETYNTLKPTTQQNNPS